MRSPILVVCAAALTLSCAGGDKAAGPSIIPSAISFVSGSGQTVRIKSAAPVTPSVKVLDQNGQAMSGVSVAFAVSAGGGSIANASATTAADGTASAGPWTMGAAAGVNELRATVQPSGGAAVVATLTATARLPRWTYMVYMAADNNLAIPGVGDIDEMEVAGADPEVQVVLQAEFNPHEFALRGCSAACAHLPNFNTFRYAISDATPSVTGPNGSVTDIGNRAMTDPAQLKEFVTWAKSTYPAERYGLVLWNHGGGYVGLLQDITSTGSKLMSLEEAKAALTGTGEVDVLNFDMCLMGGYETLTGFVGLAKVVVFSEETEPGDGDPYTEIIDALQANPTMDAKAFGSAIVDAYHASYVGDASSTTKSAYDLASLAAFESSLGTLAATLTSNVTPLASALGTAAAKSQKYSYAQLTDLIDFLDSLNVRTSDNTLKTQIADVKAKASASAFRLNNRARNGSRPESNRVHRSTGLHVLMPSKQDFDKLPSSGPESFNAYKALYPDKPWTTFLTAWLAGGAGKTYVDQGNNRYQIYLVWDSAGQSKNVDVDLWVLEPSGKLYIPFMGTVAPNGLLTDDSQTNNVNYEGYITNRYIEPGYYRFYANLYQDPQSFGPIFDIAYRTGETGNFSSLYSPNFPRLTKQSSWENDATPTFGEIESGKYSDLKYAAVLTINPPAYAARSSASAEFAVRGSAPSKPFSGEQVHAPQFAKAQGALSRSADTGELQLLQQSAPSITPAQLETVRRFMAANKLTTMQSIAASRSPRVLRTKAPRLSASPRLMQLSESR